MRGKRLRTFSGSRWRRSRVTGPRPARSSRAMARATWSRGASSSVKRSPSAFRRYAPSPRTASDTRKRGAPGTARAVGWNCTNSMSTSDAPARLAMAMPSPVATGGFVVSWNTWPAPPVASRVARASTAVSAPDSDRKRQPATSATATPPCAYPVLLSVGWSLVTTRTSPWRARPRAARRPAMPEPSTRKSARRMSSSVMKSRECPKDRFYCTRAADSDMVRWASRALVVAPHLSLPPPFSRSPRKRLAMSWTCLGLLLLAGTAGAPEEKKPVPLYTNEDLERVSKHRGETGVDSRPDGVPPAATAAASVHEDARKRDGRGEGYWRREAAKLHDRLRPRL